MTERAGGGGAWDRREGDGFAPAPQGYPPGYEPPQGGVVAWEDTSLGLFGRWWGTCRDMLFDCRKFQAASAQSEDPWPAVTFSAMSLAIAGVVQGVLIGLFYGVVGGLGALGVSRSGASVKVAGIMVAVGVGIAVIAPVMGFVAGFVFPWVAGGLHHLTLQIIGAGTKPYGSTVRVAGYASAAQLFGCVPGVGPLAALALGVIAMTLGFDETHKCGMGKAAAAAALPVFLLLVCGCGCYFAMIAGVSWAGTHHP